MTDFKKANVNFYQDSSSTSSSNVSESSVKSKIHGSLEQVKVSSVKFKLPSTPRFKQKSYNLNNNNINVKPSSLSSTPTKENKSLKDDIEVVETLPFTMTGINTWRNYPRGENTLTLFVHFSATEAAHAKLMVEKASTSPELIEIGNFANRRKMSQNLPIFSSLRR